MIIDDALVARLESLSRLELSPEEATAVKEYLAKAVVQLDQLRVLETEDVEPLVHPFPAVNCFREDEAIPSMDREKLLAAAPRKKDGCFQVPRTVE